jgi:hypothetical protein
MKAVLDLAQTVAILVGGGALIYVVLLIRKMIAERRAGQTPSDGKASRRRPY